jgi:hypothetical protein
VSVPKRVKVGDSALALHERAPALGDHVDEMTHLRVCRLEIDRPPVAAQRLRAHGADRGDYHARERGGQACREAFLAGDTSQVLDLRGAGEERQMHGALGEGVGGAAERPGVLRQRPPVHRHAQHLGPPRSETVEQVGIRGAVLLHGDAAAGDGAGGLGGGENLAPGVGLGDGEGRYQTELAQRRDGLRTARNRDAAPESGGERLAPALGLDGLDERPRADACM